MPDAKLLLSTSGTRQTLYALSGSPNDASDHYNVLEKRLFLSSRARKGELVGQVATFRITGC